jgi:radical SAM superfamily enzyme YgiQ (UPF0313 family)
MHIVLIYPPPWKIPSPGEKPGTSGDGPPTDLDAGKVIKGDILNIPYGLLSLATQAQRAGHDVSVLNLFTFAWQEIEKIIKLLPADLYGLSCFTSNRRGTLCLARLIRKIHPQAHIAVGGPHATALAREMLAHCEAIDTVVMGEGEETFTELVRRLEQKQETAGIAGTAWRFQEQVEVGPFRKRIDDLDSLASPFDFFNEYILITSRGCDWDCTFCASSVVWGPKHRFHSPDYVLDMLEKIVNVHGQKAVAIKDETFTQNRSRVLEICRGIVKRRLNFLWSCDTRADTLDAEVLFAMRRAGCQRISIGVESASAEILKTIHKNIDPQKVRKATALAKKYGFQIRFYMIIGCRGETGETLQQSIDFIRAVKPSQVIWNPFTLLPGTKEFEIAEKNGLASREMFFSDDFFELIPLLFDVENPSTPEIRQWLNNNSGLRDVWNYSVAECEEVLELLPGFHAAFLDLGGAHFQEGNLDKAKRYVLMALDRGYPLPGLCYNYLACIAARQGDWKGALENLISAKERGYHRVVEENLATTKRWIKAGGPQSSMKIELTADHGFEVTRPKQQPATPGKVHLNK